MSFILEQLKKSGKKRRIEMAILDRAKNTAAVPEPEPASDPTAAPYNSYRKPNIRPFFVYLLLSSVVIHAGIFLWRQSAWQTGKTDKTVQSAFLKQNETETVLSGRDAGRALETAVFREPVKKGQGLSGNDKAAGEPSSVTETSRGARIISGVKTRPQDNPSPVDPEQPPIKDKPSAAHQTGYSNETAETQRISDYTELPASLRKNLPAIKVTSHLYRKDSRLASINGRIMTEGNYIDGGLYLEEITPEGVILSYRNCRFRVRAE
ncbi:MAG: general secretion pathway protein GspB [Nitrospirota bacterium]